MSGGINPLSLPTFLLQNKSLKYQTDAGDMSKGSAQGSVVVASEKKYFVSINIQRKN